MRIDMNRATLAVAAGTSLNISDVKGGALRVVNGRVWMTQEGSPDDIFLTAGEAYTFSNAGTVVVSAEGCRGTAATVAFDEPLSIRSRSLLVSNWLSAFRNSWKSAIAV